MKDVVGAFQNFAFIVFNLAEVRNIYSCNSQSLLFAAKQASYMGEFWDANGGIFPPYRIFILGYMPIYANFTVNLELLLTT
ncbi:hypothetical protein [Parasediminibacterium sp. JCM 36343]|uniref:hypothetical protein n=1 Tax=Parasediminibacterium sp. JCM 36343 TaxID=3374279 RepID=UPI003979895F